MVLITELSAQGIRQLLVLYFPVRCSKGLCFWSSLDGKYLHMRVINPLRMRQKVTVVVLSAYVCFHFNCYVPRLQVESKVPLVFS